MTRSAGGIGVAVRRWGGRGFWAILDQGSFAGANFLLNVLLARWLAPEDYGGFAVAFSLFLLLSTFHAALLIEPMLVFGSGRYSETFDRYLALLLRAHVVVSLAITAALLATAAGFALAFGVDERTPTLVALAAASPFVLFQWLMRRSCYVHMNPRAAALAGSGYLAAVVAGAAALFHFGLLSAVTAIGLMALASLLAGLAIWRRPRPLGADIGLLSPFGREVLREHWRYGRWATASAALTWVPGNLFYVVLPARAGLDATAALRAVVNLTIPVVQFGGAFGTILLPAMVRARGTGALARLARNAVALFAAMALAYYGFLLAFAEPLMAWLYAGRYDAYSGIIWVVGLLPLTAGLTMVFGAVLRACEAPALVFWSYVASSAVAVLLVATLLGPFGVVGGAFGMVAASLTTALAMAAFVAWLGRGRAVEPRPRRGATVEGGPS